MLKVSALTVSYGSFEAVRQIGFEVRAGELVVLLGANGAGKTTIFRALSGLTTADRGSRIEFEGRDLSTLAPRAIVDAGHVALPGGAEAVPGPVGCHEPSAGRVSLPRQGRRLNGASHECWSSSRRWQAG